MWWTNSKRLTVFTLLTLSFIQPVSACEVCPTQKGQALSAVDIFDGPPAELATLVPDAGDEKSGFWQLGYVYDAGRIVTVRCKYTSGKIEDVPLPHKIAKCSYQIDAKKTLKLKCE